MEFLTIQFVIDFFSILNDAIFYRCFKKKQNIVQTMHISDVFSKCVRMWAHILHNLFWQIVCLFYSGIFQKKHTHWLRWTMFTEHVSSVYHKHHAFFLTMRFLTMFDQFLMRRFWSMFEKNVSNDGHRPPYPMSHISCHCWSEKEKTTLFGPTCSRIQHFFSQISLFFLNK